MLRTQISLTDDERRALDAESARTGRSLSSLIRAAIDLVYGQESSIDDDLAALREGFGAWTDREVDGEDWVDQVRSGQRLERTP